jgi:hypothetical protein
MGKIVPVLSNHSQERNVRQSAVQMATTNVRVIACKPTLLNGGARCIFSIPEYRLEEASFLMEQKGLESMLQVTRNSIFDEGELLGSHHGFTNPT